MVLIAGKSLRSWNLQYIPLARIPSPVLSLIFGSPRLRSQHLTNGIRNLQSFTTLQALSTGSLLLKRVIYNNSSVYIVLAEEFLGPSPAVLPDNQISSSIDTSQTAAETINTNGWGVSDDSSSHKGWGSSLQSASISTNGWGSSDDISTHTGQRKHSEISNNGWMNKPTKDKYSDWGVLYSKPDDSSEAINTKGWGSSTGIYSYNGWEQSLGCGHSEANSNGWVEKPAKDDYNGWGVLNSTPVNQLNQHVPNHDNSCHVVSQNSFSSASATVPSAPPMPDDGTSDGQILYPSIDFSKAVSAIAEASVANGFNNGSGGSGGGESSCVICWEAPIEGACVPCGHMAGCIACLNDVKARKGVCPICRTKLEQVVKLYVV